MHSLDYSSVAASSRQNNLEMAGRLDAKNVFQYLMKKVEEHQSNLKSDEELGIKLANFGEASQIHIRNIGYKNPNIIEFYGINLDGSTVMLIQHISQLNFMLVTMKTFSEKAYRIGFKAE